MNAVERYAEHEYQVMPIRAIHLFTTNSGWILLWAKHHPMNMGMSASECLDKLHDMGIPDLDVKVKH